MAAICAGLLSRVQMPKGGVLPAWVGAAIQQFQSRDWRKPFTSIDQPLSCVPQTSQAAVKRSRRWSVQLLAAPLPNPPHLPSSQRALLSFNSDPQVPPSSPSILISGGSTGIFNFRKMKTYHPISKPVGFSPIADFTRIYTPFPSALGHGFFIISCC